MKKLLVLIGICFCLSGGMVSHAAEHVHTDDCYETFRVPACDKNHGNKHKKSCYIVVKVLDCAHAQKADDTSGKTGTKDKGSETGRDKDSAGSGNKDKGSGSDKDKDSAGSDSKTGTKDKGSETGRDKDSAGSGNKDKGSGSDKDKDSAGSDSKTGTKVKGSGIDKDKDAVGSDNKTGTKNKGSDNKPTKDESPDSKGSGDKAKKPNSKAGQKDKDTGSFKKPSAGFGDVKNPKPGNNVNVREHAEDKAHTHTEDCYTIIRILTCKSSEDEHKHTDKCYTTARLFTCGMDTNKVQILSCGQDSHIHDDGCFTDATWSCNERSGTHIHDTSCFTENASDSAAQKNKAEADDESETDLMKQWFWYFLFAVGGILVFLVMKCIHDYRHNKRAG